MNTPYEPTKPGPKYVILNSSKWAALNSVTKKTHTEELCMYQHVHELTRKLRACAFNVTKVQTIPEDGRDQHHVRRARNQTFIRG